MPVHTVKKKGPLKGYKNRVIPEGKKQVNFNLQNDLLDKVAGIAAQEAVSKTQVLARAVEKYVEEYEKARGPVRRSVRRGLP